MTTAVYFGECKKFCYTLQISATQRSLRKRGGGGGVIDQYMCSYIRTGCPNTRPLEDSASLLSAPILCRGDVLTINTSLNGIHFITSYRVRRELQNHQRLFVLSLKLYNKVSTLYVVKLRLQMRANIVFSTLSREAMSLEREQ